MDYLFANKRYTKEEFISEFCGGDVAVGEKTIIAMMNKGIMVDYCAPKTKEQKSILSAMAEEDIRESANMHDTYDEAEKDFVKQKKNEGKLTHDKVEFDFSSIFTSKEFLAYVKEDLRLKAKIVIGEDDCYVVEAYDCTDADVNKMAFRYKSDNAVKKILSGVDKTATMATDTVHYASTRVVVPTVQVSAKAGASILKTLFSTGAKATGTVISAITQGTKDCIKEVTEDADVLRATRDLIDVKNSAGRAVKNIGGVSSGGGMRIS